MGSLSQTNGHDFPALIDAFGPGEAAVIDDIVMGFEDAVGERLCRRFGPFWTMIIYFTWNHVHLQSR